MEHCGEREVDLDEDQAILRQKVRESILLANYLPSSDVYVSFLITFMHSNFSQVDR